MLASYVYINRKEVIKMLIPSSVLVPIIKKDIVTIESEYPYVYNWLTESARRIGMRPKKLRVLLLELFQHRYYVLDMTSRVNRIIRC